MGIRVQEALIHLERALQVERPKVEHRAHAHRRLHALLDRSERIDLAQTLLDARKVRRAHQVNLVEQDAIRKRHLLDRLVLGALGFLLVQVLLHVLRIDHGDDAIEAEVLFDGLI